MLTTDVILDLLLCIKNWSKETEFSWERKIEIFDTSLTYNSNYNTITYRHRDSILFFELNKNKATLETFRWSSSISGVWLQVNLNSDKGLQLIDTMLSNLKSKIRQKRKQLVSSCS